MVGALGVSSKSNTALLVKLAANVATGRTFGTAKVVKEGVDRGITWALLTSIGKTLESATVTASYAAGTTQTGLLLGLATTLGVLAIVGAAAYYISGDEETDESVGASSEASTSTGTSEAPSEGEYSDAGAATETAGTSDDSSGADGNATLIQYINYGITHGTALPFTYRGKQRTASFVGRNTANRSTNGPLVMATDPWRQFHLDAMSVSAGEKMAYAPGCSQESTSLIVYR
jgi:hypothetical protein